MRFSLLIAVCLATQSTLQGSDTLRLMTYNIRLDTPNDGPNQWGKRSHKVFALLSKYAPDILGTQEALPNQVKDFSEGLPAYNYVGVGRDDGNSAGEFCAVFYQKDRFEAMRHGTFWLSKNPEKPGSKDWDAAITRICTWVKLREKATRQVIFVFNTHFDHIGQTARLNSALLLRKKIKEICRKTPFVLMGDFNCQPDEPPYFNILNAGRKDVYDSCTEVGNKACTFRGFALKSEICNRIDYIFLHQKFKTLSCSVPDDNDGENYPSDHLPVMAVVKLN